MNPFEKALRERQLAWSKTISNETRARALSELARQAARGDAYATELIERSAKKLPWLADKMAAAVEAERLALPPPPPKDLEPASSASTQPQGEFASGHAKGAEGPLGKVLNGTSRPPGLHWSNVLKKLFDRATDDPSTNWMKRR